MTYNKEAILANIEKIKVNIKTFEDAIEKERTTIKQYYDMIDQMDEQERKKKEALSHISIEE